VSENKSRLQTLFEQGEFVVTGEIGPPKSANGEGIRKHAEHLKGYCDATNLTDNQTAIVRLSSIAAGMHVLKAGGEPIAGTGTGLPSRVIFWEPTAWV